VGLLFGRGKRVDLEVVHGAHGTEEEKKERAHRLKFPLPNRGGE